METQIQETTREGNFTELNGVDVTKLQDTIAAIKKDPSLAKFQFRTSNEWITCGYNKSEIKAFYGAGEEHGPDVRFTLEADEPEVLLGSNKAVDPAEFVLHALSACMTATIAYHSAARGITIKSINSSCEGDVDLQGFLGLSDKVKKGFSEVRVKFNVETDATEKDLRELITFSPVYEIVSAGVPIKVDFNITKPVLS